MIANQSNFVKSFAKPPETRSIYERVMDRFQCDHEESEIRFKVYSNNTKHYFEQCNDCGSQLGAAIKHADIEDIDNVPEWNKDTEQHYLASKLAYQVELQEEQARRQRNKEGDWWSWYSEYLSSPEWQSKRARVLQRDELCQACLKRKATQAHHKTYEHVGNEPLFDLVGVCNVCHDFLSMDKGANNA